MRKRSWVIAGICAGALCSSLAPNIVFAADRTIDPGLWEVTTKADIGGPAQTARRCMTTTDIANGFATDSLPKDCKFTKSVVSGGKLDFASTCPDMSMTMSGTYTPTSYVIDGKIVMKGDDPMTMTSHITGRKIADACKGG